MRPGAWSAVAAAPRVGAAGAALLLSLGIAAGSWVLAGGVVLASAGLALGLYAPAAALLGALATGPTLGSWLDVTVGWGPAITADRCLFALAGAAVGVRWLLRAPRPAVGAPVWCMAAFLAVAAASAVAGGGTRLSMAEGGLRNDLLFLVLGYGAPFAAFVLAQVLLFTPTHLRWVLRTLVAVGVFVAIAGILQTFFGVTRFTPTRMEVIHSGRATGPLTSAVEFGLVLGAAIITAVVMLARGGPLGRRVVLAGALGLMVAAAVASRTRAPWLGIGVGLGVVAWRERRLRRPLAVCAGVGAGALVVAWPLIADSDFISGRLLDLTPVYNRVTLTATALNMFAHHPIDGLGFGRYTFHTEKWGHLVSFGDVSPHYAYSLGVPHNEFLHILLMVGLLGFIPYAAVLALGWRTAGAQCRATSAEGGPARDAALVCQGVLAMYLVSALFSDMMFYQYASTQLYTLLGICYGQLVRRRRRAIEGGA